MQAELGSCSINDIAVALASPVVSIHYNKEEVCIYGGAVHLSKDKSMSSSFGKVAVRSNDDLKVIEGAIVDRVSQEHGMIKLPKKELDKICLGDVLYILPIHSCLTAENMGEYYSKSSTRLDHYAQKKRD